MLTSILIGLIFAILIVWQSLSVKYRRIMRLFQLLVIIIIVMTTEYSLALLFGVIATTGFFLMTYLVLSPIGNNDNGNNDN